MSSTFCSLPFYAIRAGDASHLFSICPAKIIRQILARIALSATESSSIFFPNPAVPCNHPLHTRGSSTCSPHSPPVTPAVSYFCLLTIWQLLFTKLTSHQQPTTLCLSSGCPLPIFSQACKGVGKKENSLTYWHVLTLSHLSMPPCVSILLTFASLKSPDLTAMSSPSTLPKVLTFLTVLYPLQISLLHVEGSSFLFSTYSCSWCLIPSFKKAWSIHTLSSNMAADTCQDCRKERTAGMLDTSIWTIKDCKGEI